MGWIINSKGLHFSYTAFNCHLASCDSKYLYFECLEAFSNYQFISITFKFGVKYTNAIIIIVE